jgi:hypothetical protein
MVVSAPQQDDRYRWPHSDKLMWKRCGAYGDAVHLLPYATYHYWRLSRHPKRRPMLGTVKQQQTELAGVPVQPSWRRKGWGTALQTTKAVGGMPDRGREQACMQIQDRCRFDGVPGTQPSSLTVQSEGPGPRSFFTSLGMVPANITTSALGLQHLWSSCTRVYAS